MKSLEDKGFESEIKNALIKVTQEGARHEIKGDGEWTKKIKLLLGELGERSGFGVCTGGFKDRFEPEWLCDLAWYRENEAEFLVEVPLVMESEWNRTLKYIKFDFEKLLLTNATLRLMICQAKPEKIDDLKVFFRNAVKAYGQLDKGSRFLIAVLDSDSEEFVFDTFEKE